MSVLSYQLQVAENLITVMPPKVVSVPANTATLILPNQSVQDIAGALDSSQIVQRLVQNCSPDTNLYLSFGLGSDEAPKCDNVKNFHCILGPLQQRDVSNDRRRVAAFATGAVEVATEVRYRQTNLAGLEPVGN